MNRFNVGIPMLVLVAVAFVAGGCEDKAKGLQIQLDQANGALRDLQALHAKCEGEKGDLRDQLAQRDTMIAQLQGQLKKGPGPVAGGTSNGAAKGWEEGLYGDRVTLESDILFPAGKATLTAAGKGHLDTVAAELKKKYAGMPVRVFGFTDTDPIRKTKDLWEDNLDLSANRAMTVTRYLLSKGVPARNVETVAMGEWHPEKDKAKSRRVEIVVIKKSPGLTPAPKELP